MRHQESRHRSRSPRGQQAHDYRESRRDSDAQVCSRQSRESPVMSLPFNAQPLSRHDLAQYRPMFALYLDIQKHIDIDDLSDHEVKGRWKSFIGKWNTRVLSEGWYDPKTLDKAIASSNNYAKPARSGSRMEENDGSEEDEFGPSLPSEVLQHAPGTLLSFGTRHGPAIPHLQDLQSHHETTEQEMQSRRHQNFLEAKHNRAADRLAQRELIEELVPKATAGTRDRQLEKRREQALSNAVFAASKDAGGDVDLREADVMGGDDDLDQLKRMKQANERKMTEREIRRDEIRRARMAEREEKVNEMKVKEERTMGMLKEIARARFGA